MPGTLERARNEAKAIRAGAQALRDEGAPQTAIDANERRAQEVLDEGIKLHLTQLGDVTKILRKAAASGGGSALVDPTALSSQTGFDLDTINEIVAKLNYDEVPGRRGYFAIPQ